MLEKLTVSLVCADPLNLERDLEFLKREGIKKVHLDIMDANYVPRFGIYPEIHRALVDKFDFEVDAHFMVSRVSDALREWSKYAVPKKISFHYKDNKDNVSGLLSEIRSLGSKAIIIFDYSIDPSEIESVIREYKPDGVMLMAIIPGVLKQNHRPEVVIETLKHIKQLDGICLEYIQVDGGVNMSTVTKMLDAGANELVCGSSTVFKNADIGLNYYESIRSNLNELRALENV